MLQVATIQNALLEELADEDRRFLKRDSEQVLLTQDRTLYAQGDAFEYLYFPINCVVSSVAVTSDGASVEVFMIGREGLTGVISLFGDQRSRNWTRVLIAGRAIKVSAEAVRRLFAESETAQQALLGYYHTLLTHISQRAVCNGRHTIIQRLCCWLLMLRDRVDADEIDLTQEAIAARLGVRRAGITQAARSLLNGGAVSYYHGRIQIRERRLLERTSCECYRVHAEVFSESLARVQDFGAGGANATAAQEERDKLFLISTE